MFASLPNARLPLVFVGLTLVLIICADGNNASADDRLRLLTLPGQTLSEPRCAELQTYLEKVSSRRREQSDTNLRVRWVRLNQSDVADAYSDYDWTVCGSRFYYGYAANKGLGCLNASDGCIFWIRPSADRGRLRLAMEYVGRRPECKGDLVYCAYYTYKPDPDQATAPKTEDSDYWVATNINGLSAFGQDGELLWRFKAPSRFWNVFDHEKQWTSGDVSRPAFGPDGTIYISCTDGYLYALGQGGKQLWRSKIFGALVGSGWTPRRPAITPQGVVVVVPNEGKARLVSVSFDGHIRWSRILSDSADGDSMELESISDLLPSSDGQVYLVVHHKGILLSVDRESRISTIYKHPTGSLSTPCLGADGKIYVGASDGFLLALDKTGKMIWQSKLKGPARLQPVLDKDGRVYVATQTGWLQCISDGGSVLWNWWAGDEIGNDKKWPGSYVFPAVPTITDDAIYIRVRHSIPEWKYSAVMLYCVDLDPEKS